MRPLDGCAPQRFYSPIEPLRDPAYRRASHALTQQCFSHVAHLALRYTAHVGLHHHLVHFFTPAPVAAHHVGGRAAFPAARHHHVDLTQAREQAPEVRAVPVVLPAADPLETTRSDHRFQLLLQHHLERHTNRALKQRLQIPAVTLPCVARSTSTIFSMRKLLSGSGPAGAGPDSPGSCDDEHSQGASSLFPGLSTLPPDPSPPFTQISRHYRKQLYGGRGGGAGWVASTGLAQSLRSRRPVLIAEEIVPLALSDHHASSTQRPQSLV